MTVFDAEFYLRRLGEHMLLGVTDEQRGFASSLNDAATALVAVDVITLERAREVLGDYAAAEAARDAQGQFLMRRLSARERAITPTPPPVPRMVALDDELAIAGWSVRLRYIALGAESVDISAVYIAQDGAGAPRRGLGFAGLPGPLRRPAVADDRGTTSTLDFRGGGSDDRWEGLLTADQPLAIETTWIDLFDRRIELVDAPVEAEIATEPVEPIDPAHRHLWRRVALGGRHFSQSELGPATQALVASGALAADDPTIELAQRISERVPGAFPRHGQTGSVRNAPEPWRSLLRRAGRSDGQEGLVVVGAVTPEFDDHFAAVYCLESGASGFSVEAAVSPPDVERHPGNLDLEDRSLAWWARDDRGNHYLGQWNGTHGQDDAIKTGTLAFSPALDPLAKRLDVLPTGLTARAVISFALPWNADAA